MIYLLYLIFTIKKGEFNIDNNKISLYIIINYLNN